jgi:hypothetical protein
VKVRFLILLLLLTGPASLGAEQVTMRHLEETIGRAIAAKESAWRRKDVGLLPKRRADGTEMEIMRWTPRDEVKVLSVDGTSPHPRPDLGLELYLYSSKEGAAEDLKRIAQGPYGRPNGVVKDLGDEGYAWTGWPDGSAIVRARIGRAGIKISGPSPDVTMRFAELIVRELQAEFKKAEEIP